MWVLIPSERLNNLAFPLLTPFVYFIQTTFFAKISFFFLSSFMSGATPSILTKTIARSQKHPVREAA
jgi:hypothetical protein